MENSFFEGIKDDATRYGQALGKAGQLRLVGMTSRIIGLFLLIFTITLCVLALFTFGAVAAIDAMATCMPVWAAALIVGSAYVVLIAIAILCRKPLFVNPFIKVLSKQVVNTEEELDLAVVKADHEVEMESVRIRAKVENTTRAIDFYAGLINRIWDWFTRRKE